VVNRLDPVSSRLRAAGDEQRASALQWIDNQQRRRVMRRRAKACVIGGWLLMVTAALIGSVVSIYMSSQIQAILASESSPEVNTVLSTRYVPAILLGITAVLMIGGAIMWFVQLVPGLSRTVSAIDWAAASDAVMRLVRAGVNFPEAFRAAADVSTMRRNQRWLIETARRIESGGPELNEHSVATGDAAIVETLVSSLPNEPDRRWKVAADHFVHVAQRRLALLLQTTPMIATILSGLIVWLAISSTLGWMWRAVAALLQDMGMGGPF